MSFTGDSIFWVEIEKVVPNPYQPRREFDESRLKELAESVRMYGILQPLTVTRKEVQNADGSFRSEYELIAGERRLRASKLAGLTQVPVIIRDGEQSEQEKLELAIIENLQREDLNAVDRALAFRQLADVFGLSHTQVAKKMGRSREYVSNSVRLLMLPDYMLSSLRVGDISEGHARTLLMLNDRPEEQDTLFREILLKKLSVREVERIARGIAYDKVRKKETVNVELLDLERQFTETLGTRVSIVKTDYGGKLTIDYFDEDDLTKLLEQIKHEGKFHTTLPEEGTVRDAMALQEDKEAKTALETLTEATGLMPANEHVDTSTTPIMTHSKEQSEALINPAEIESIDDTDFVYNGIGTVATHSNSEDINLYTDIKSSYDHEPHVMNEDSVVTKTEVSMIKDSNRVPVVAEVVPAPPAAPTPVNPLKAQLASLLGNFESTAEEAVIAPPLSEVKPATVFTAPDQTTQTSQIPSAPVPPKAIEDESDLYSINQFTI